MIKKFILLLTPMILLSGCVDRWSEFSVDGTPLAVAEPECRAKARVSARRQLPFPFDYNPGPAGFPPDSAADIENRETALCLQNRGFRLMRE